MRTRAKALTVSVALAASFAILPVFGAAAAEPLADGAYDVLIGEDTYTVLVVDGVPAVAESEGVAFIFAYDDETGRVLDEFDVDVDGQRFEAEVDDAGAVAVGAADVEESETPTSEFEDIEVLQDETDGEDETDETDKTDDESDEAEDGAHGTLVSTVAKCAPKGRVAKDAGLPNHGAFVSAAAKGETVTFEAGGETVTADLSTLEGAEAFCALAADLLPDTEESEVEGEKAEKAEKRDKADKAEKAEKREKAEKGDKGRSADAPGKQKQKDGREDVAEDEDDAKVEDDD